MLQKFKHQDFCNPRFILNVLDSDIVVRLHIVSITQHNTVTSSTRTLQSWGIMLCLTRILKACLPLHLIWTSWKKSSQPAGKDKEEREYRLQGPPPTLGPEASSQSKEDLGFYLRLGIGWLDKITIANPLFSIHLWVWIRDAFHFSCPFFEDRTAPRLRRLSRRVISGKSLKHQSEFFA